MSKLRLHMGVQTRPRSPTWQSWSLGAWVGGGSTWDGPGQTQLFREAGKWCFPQAGPASCPDPGALSRGLPSCPPALGQDSTCFLFPEGRARPLRCQPQTGQSPRGAPGGGSDPPFSFSKRRTGPEPRQQPLRPGQKEEGGLHPLPAVRAERPAHPRAVHSQVQG